MNPRVRMIRRAEWDGTFSLLLDGEVLLERKPLAEIEAKEAFLITMLTLQSLPLTPPVD